jgi:mannosyltransferase
LNRLRGVGYPLILTALGLAVRLHKLTYHSLWFDEAMSVHWARSSVPRILEVSMKLVEDRLPPLYYLSLHFWRLLVPIGNPAVGDSELAVRFPSVLLGTLLIPLVYRLAADLFGDRRVAALAAALTAFNPFLVWYSQEARMYAQAVLLSTLGTWFLLQASIRSLRRHRRDVIDAINDAPTATIGAPYWLAYGLCAVAGLYTHLYTGFLLPAHGVYLLLTHRRSRRAWLPFALTMLAVAVLFAPLAVATWQASGEAGPGNPLIGTWARAWWLLSGFSVWKAPLSPALVIAAVSIMSTFTIVGLLIPYRRTPQASVPSPRILVATLLLTPVAIATGLLIRNQVAFFGQRYFIVIVPWLLVAVAAGAVNLATRLRVVPLPVNFLSHVTPHLLPALCYLLPIGFTLLPLPGQWSSSARKEAWRETAAYLATHARPEDAILIHPDWTRYPLQYYFQGPGQTYAIFGSVKDDTDLDGPLTSISQAHPTVWLVESHTELADPEHQVNAWLAAHFPRVTELYPPGLTAVRAYASGYLSDHLPELATPARLSFQGGLKLAGFVVPEKKIAAADELFHPPSGWVHVTLYWTVETPPGQDYTPFVHLVDDLGQVWGASLERPNDVFDFYPATRWEPGQVIRSDFDVNLNPVTPPGQYILAVGLRDASGLQAALIDGSPQAPLATVQVLR